MLSQYPHDPVSNRLCSGWICVAGLLAGLAGTASAADRPVIQPAPDVVAGSSSEPILGPMPPAGWIPSLFMGEIFFTPLDPIDEADKGSVLTDMGAGFPLAEPNALERLKLEMARQAVESSRAAGTLFVNPPAIDLFSAPSGIEKIDAMREAPAAPLSPDPAACIGDLPPLQIPGDGEPTPAETEKLRAAQKEGN